MKRSPLRLAGRLLRRAGNDLLNVGSLKGIWIDVGAHLGETTLTYATQNPELTVYAFEPNLRVAAPMFGCATNFIVLPMAVAETDGHAKLYVNLYDAASSLLPMSESSRRSWIGGDVLIVAKTITVPTIRLDTFMEVFSIRTVNFLKVDTQGTDLAVLRSAGSRLRDVERITIEVDVTPARLYEGSASKDETIAFLREAGFELIQIQKQTYGQEENLTFQRVG